MNSALSGFADLQHFTDTELVSLSRGERGNEETIRRRALDELFGRYYQRVSLWCYRLTGNQDEAADLAQEVFLKAYRGLASYRGESKFSTWLYTIARNQSFTRSKAQSAEGREEDLPELVDRSPDPLQQLMQNNSRQFVQKLLGEVLTKTEAAVMKLHFGDELPLGTISRLLNLENPSGAKAYEVSAKRKLARALDRLRLRERRIG